MRFTLTCWVSKASEEKLRADKDLLRDAVNKMNTDAEMIGLPAGRVEFRREDTGALSDLPTE